MTLYNEIQWDGGDLAMRYPWRSVSRNRWKRDKAEARYQQALRYANTPEANNMPRLKFTGTGVEVYGWKAPDKNDRRGRGKNKRRN